MLKRASVVLLIVSLGGCWDECSMYSRFTCSQIQNATYNVLFRHARSTRDEHVGQVMGLSECGRLARSYAAQMGAEGRWSYTCCMAAGGSSCLERHR